MTVIDKAKKVKLCIFDIDGIFTNCQVWVNETGDMLHSFNILDGFGIKLLKQSGINVAVISGRSPVGSKSRLEAIGIKDIYLGQQDKRSCFVKLCQKFEVSSEDVSYMGDDLLDLPLIKKSGFGITVPNAVQVVKDHSDFITSNAGGHGAVREAIDYILDAQGKLSDIHSYYLNQTVDV